MHRLVSFLTEIAAIPGKTTRRFSKIKSPEFVGEMSYEEYGSVGTPKSPVSVRRLDVGFVNLQTVRPAKLILSLDVHCFAFLSRQFLAAEKFFAERSTGVARNYIPTNGS
jgi:hypothetical protein